MDAAVRRRVDELAEARGLSAAAADGCRRLLDLLARHPAAPTTVTAPAEAVDVHLADSLAGLELEAVRAGGRIADLGTGAGFPGLPLALALPAAHVDLVESAGRKAPFLEEAVAASGARNASVLVARAEEVREAPYDVVTARALAPLGVLAEYAAPLLAEGGALVAWKGARDPAEERTGTAAAAAVGLEPAAVLPVRPWEGVEHRHLYLYLKVRPTPERFPRRPGMARKRPLGVEPQARPASG